MDEPENIVMEDNCRKGENDGNEVMCPKRNATQKSVTDELEFETEDEYGIHVGDIPKVAHGESNSPEHFALSTKTHGEVVVERTCSHSRIRKSENFDIDEFDVAGQDLQENQCGDESSAENVAESTKQSSSEISQNKVASLLTFISWMRRVTLLEFHFTIQRF